MAARRANSPLLTYARFAGQIFSTAIAGIGTQRDGW